MVGIKHDAVVVDEWDAGKRAGQREDGHAVEDILQDLELEAAAVAFRHDRDPRVVKVGLDVGHRAGELGGHRPVPQLLEECLVGTADRLQLGAGIGEQRVGDVNEFSKIHALGDPVEAADDHGAARQHARDRPFSEPSTTVAGGQHAHRLVAAPPLIEFEVLLRDRRHEVDGVDEFAFQARYFESIEADGLAFEKQRLALGDLGA